MVIIINMFNIYIYIYICVCVDNGFAFVPKHMSTRHHFYLIVRSYFCYRYFAYISMTCISCGD